MLGMGMQRNWIIFSPPRIGIKEEAGLELFQFDSFDLR